MTASTMAADPRVHQLAAETRKAAATLQGLQTEVDYYTNDPLWLACHALEARLADLVSAQVDLASVMADLDRIDAELADLAEPAHEGRAAA